MSQTESVKRSMLKRLGEVFMDLEHISFRDYPIVKSELGWAESTFKTALRHLGKDTGNLRDGVRAYVPTDSEIETLKQVVDPHLVTVLCLTGCRLGEAWRMGLQGNILTTYTQKGGELVTRDISGYSPETRAAIVYWVLVGSKKLKLKTAQQRWTRAIRKGLVSPDCIAHNLRHRAAVLMRDAGVPIETISYLLGHKNISVTLRYFHRTSAHTEMEEAILGPSNAHERTNYKVSHRGNVHEWTTLCNSLSSNRGG